MLAVCDVAARLAVPISLLALTRGYGLAAMGAAATVSLLAIVRGLLSGAVFERALGRIWRSMASSAQARSVVALRARPEEQDVVLLLDASREAARIDALVLPKLAANAIGLGLAALAIGQHLGFFALLLAVVVLLVVGAFIALAQRRLGRFKERAWRGYGELARDFGALLDGASELRAHGREASFIAELHTAVQRMARAERQVNTTSTLLGLFPVGVALLVAFAPLRHTISGWLGQLELESFATTSVLGATALIFAAGLAHTTEELARATPFRRTIKEYFTGGPAPPPRGSPVRLPLRTAVIEFEQVSIQFAGSRFLTPAGVSHCWSPGQGLAITGDNGAGKTSLALALLGLLRPAGGVVRIDGVEVRGSDWIGVEGQVAYQPQHPFVAPGATVGWHLRLVLGDGPSESEFEEALRQVGLLAVLEGRSGGSPLAVVVGELSGGERRRLHLARALVGDPDLVVLDEPEAGLDPAGRTELRSLLASLAQQRRVVLIAHDPNIIPDRFERLECVRRPVGA